MAVNCSTGFRSRILGPSAFESIFLNGCIEVRTGPQPAAGANAPATGTLIERIPNNGGGWNAGASPNGLRFGRSGVYARNDPAQTWRLTGLATGVAGWFRLVGNAPDDGGLSTVLPRIDGACGPLEGAGDYQLRLPNLSINPSTTTAIASWWLVLPPIE
jgi:hypothetical protein